MKLWVHSFYCTKPAKKLVTPERHFFSKRRKIKLSSNVRNYITPVNLFGFSFLFILKKGNNYKTQLNDKKFQLKQI